MKKIRCFLMIASVLFLAPAAEAAPVAEAACAGDACVAADAGCTGVERFDADHAAPTYSCAGASPGCVGVHVQFDASGAFGFPYVEGHCKGVSRGCVGAAWGAYQPDGSGWAGRPACEGVAPPMWPVPVP